MDVNYRQEREKYLTFLFKRQIIKLLKNYVGYGVLMLLGAVVSYVIFANNGMRIGILELCGWTLLFWAGILSANALLCWIVYRFDLKAIRR